VSDDGDPKPGDDSSDAPFACDVPAAPDTRRAPPELAAEWSGLDGPANTDADGTADVAPEATARPIADVVSDLAKSQGIVRLATGIPTLDGAMRGGIPSRRLVVFGGAPGAGKTSVVTRLGYQWARGGFTVGMLCADEGPEGIVDRVSLYESSRRDLLEAGDADEWARLGAAVQGLPLILDPGDMTIEGMAALVRERAGDAPAVLIVDSIQTARANAEGGDRSDRRGILRYRRTRRSRMPRPRPLAASSDLGPEDC